MLENINNYGDYVELTENYSMCINTSCINASNWEQHIQSILNILRDGIELPEIQNSFITVIFADDVDVELSIFDYFFNIIFWNFALSVNEPITSEYLFFEENITKKSIKAYIDSRFIEKYRTSLPNIRINNIIDDTLCQFRFIDDFSMYLANTINLEDTIALMNEYKEFYDLIHADLSNVPLEDAKNVGMEYTNKSIEYIKNSNHCLADSFRAGEGINPKQYKEFTVNIGSKPDGRGGAFPAIINTNFLIGGVNDILSYLIESATGRTAQILQKMNVGSSGHFARLLGLNNTDTIIHHDSHYSCDTKNFQPVIIRDEKVLYMYENRYYRFSPNGIEYKVKQGDKHLIGKTLYFRSPMTCASAARGEGICYKCYGDLAYTNCDINPGKLGAEIISAILTQILLSAKHLLESLIKKMKWSKGFYDLFEVEANVIRLIEDNNYKGYKLLIDAANIHLEDEFDNYEYNEYINEFEVETPEGEIIKIHTTESDNIYISTDLNDIIRKKGEPDDGKIIINMVELKEMSIFLMHIHNNELSRTLDKLKDIIDKNSVTKSLNREQLLQAFIDTVNEGNLNVTGVHCEVILSNQLRNINDILEKPQWEFPNEQCDVLTLNQSLMNNPSITIRMSYQRLSKTLYNPLTFRTNKPSFLDLFFMEQPSEYLNNVDITESKLPSDKEVNLVDPISFIKNEDDIEVPDEC